MSSEGVYDIICDTCQYVFGEKSPLNVPHKKDTSEIYVKHLHITDLRKSYLNGCHLCALILYTLSGLGKDPQSWPEMCELSLSTLEHERQRDDVQEDFHIWLSIVYYSKTRYGWSVSERWDAKDSACWTDEFRLNVLKKDPRVEKFGRLSGTIKCSPRRGK